MSSTTQISTLSNPETALAFMQNQSSVIKGVDARLNETSIKAHEACLSRIEKLHGTEKKLLDSIDSYKMLSISEKSRRVESKKLHESEVKALNEECTLLSSLLTKARQEELQAWWQQYPFLFSSLITDRVCVWGERLFRERSLIDEFKEYCRPIIRDLPSHLLGSSERISLWMQEKVQEEGLIGRFAVLEDPEKPSRPCLDWHIVIPVKDLGSSESICLALCLEALGEGYLTTRAIFKDPHTSPNSHTLTFQWFFEKGELYGSFTTFHASEMIQEDKIELPFLYEKTEDPLGYESVLFYETAKYPNKGEPKIEKQNYLGSCIRPVFANRKVKSSVQMSIDRLKDDLEKALNYARGEL